MQTNNLFSFQRFLLLCKQSLIINKKIIAIALSAYSGILFIALILFQSINHFNNWEFTAYTILFVILFFIMGIGYSSSAFPAFRSKEKSLIYLMLPASLFEKFIFEFLSRIILFLLLMPLLYWLIVYLESALVHSFVPDFERFNVLNSLWNFESFKIGSNPGTFNGGTFDGWTKYSTIQNFLLTLFTTFAGASYFSKSPLLKTMLTVTIIYSAYGILISLLFKGLDISMMNGRSQGLYMFLLKNQHDTKVFASLMLTATNLALLAIAFFRLKEKEI